jgi:hypothetical protein
MSFDGPATSSHFDSPDRSPVHPTEVLPPFMFVAGHHARNNPEFSGFHFSPPFGEVSALSLPFADASGYGNGPAPHSQPRPHDFMTMNSESLLEGPAWTADHIDDIIRSMQSFEYESQQPNPFMSF